MILHRQGQYKSFDTNLICLIKWSEAGLKREICLADSFEFTIYHSTRLKAFIHKWTSLNRIAANKSHSVIVYVAWESNGSRLFSKLDFLLSQNFVHYFYQILDLWISDNYLKRDTCKIN